MIKNKHSFLIFPARILIFYPCQNTIQLTSVFSFSNIYDCENIKTNNYPTNLLLKDKYKVDDLTKAE